MNEEKFTGKADLYEKYRPSYPSELIDWLYDNTKAETVADVGAGTGKFTRCLAAKPWKITAVEPNSDMRSKLDIQGVNVAAGTAENTTLPDKSIDLVTTAQAFHWFDRDKFKAECKRILKPSGSLAIVYNERRKCEYSEERDEIFIKYCGKTHVNRITAEGEKMGDEYLKDGFFSSLKTFVVNNNSELDLDVYIGRELSSSFAPREGAPYYEEFKQALEGLFNKYQKDGKLEVKRVCVCYLGLF